MHPQQPMQVPAQRSAQPVAAMETPAAALPSPASELIAGEQRRGSGAGPFGARLQALPQDCEANLSEVFGGHDGGGWKRSGWRS